MRILQVVTLVSPDAAYGGPVTVCVNQAAALRELGHDVTILAGTRGYDVAPTELAGSPAILLPTRQVVPHTGFAGLASTGAWRWWRRHRGEFDVVHVHMARDLITLPLALMAEAASAPVVLQTHGMIDPSERLLAKIADPVLTRRALRRASAVLYLTEHERTDLLHVEPRIASLVNLPNGVPVDHPAALLDHAASREVLFLARLHERKRPTQFIQAAAELATRWPDWTFTLVGPDEGEAPRVRALLTEVGNPRIRWEGPASKEESLLRMGRAAIFAQPAVDEPFPMSVLEAMSVGLPVVVTTTCGLADAVAQARAGAVIGDSVPELVGALEALIGDSDARQGAGESARRVATDRFGMAGIGRALEAVYERATAGG